VGDWGKIHQWGQPTKAYGLCRKWLDWSAIRPKGAFASGKITLAEDGEVDGLTLSHSNLA